MYTPTGERAELQRLAGMEHSGTETAPLSDQTVLCRTNGSRKISSGLAIHFLLTYYLEAAIIKMSLALRYIYWLEKGAILNCPKFPRIQLQRATVDAILQEVQQRGRNIVVQ
jgi:hypothetical protein